ncbi:peptidoglycan recognition protein family protein [Nocardia sp. CY41]|uniref:peptidoglycan recognition protein family protein n=1 Tax=Nocardia sp. CY41 TaxID=2608686 RepID=UPI001357269F|nr:peptidoglycan recognition family protein [Nocardia sp. CY41]
MDDPTTRVQVSPNKHSGGRNVTWVAIHTQEGRGTAASLTNYLCNPNSQVSYNAVVDDAETVLVVPWELNPWSASNANSRADHVCLAGTFASWSRGKWLETNDSDGVDEDLMLTRAAELVAWRCLERDIPIEYVGDGSVPPDRPGVCGHADFGQWGGGHTDPGPNFPWDELIRRAQNFAAGIGDSEMPALEETFKNYKGETVTLGTAVFFLDQYVNEIREQLGGPTPFKGWKQLGDKTVVDSLADAHRKIDALTDLIGKLVAAKGQ